MSKIGSSNGCLTELCKTPVCLIGHDSQ